MPENSFGENVHQARTAKGLTRPQLAARAGTSPSTIARLELNGHLPSMRIANAVALALDMRIELVKVVVAS